MNKRKIEQAIKKHAENEALDFFLSVYPHKKPFSEILDAIGTDEGNAPWAVYATDEYCHYDKSDLIEMITAHKNHHILSIKNLLKKIGVYNDD